MAASNPPSLLERSSLVRFFRSLFTWSSARRILIFLAWTFTLIALGYAEENWRGRRAWNRYRNDIESRGEQVDFKAHLPKPVPDDQNFGALPIAKAWFDKQKAEENEARWKDDYSKVLDAFPRKPEIPASLKGRRRFMDLAWWEAAFQAVATKQTNRPPQLVGNKPDLRTKAAPGVLKGLKSSEAVLNELRAGSSRPYCRYPVNYEQENPWAILLPHLVNLRPACLRLQLKACAELALGQNDEALEDVNLMFYLADSVKDEPILISFLVRASCYQIAMQPIWEGLVEHHWSEAQLKNLQSRLETNNLLADMKRPLLAERAAGILTVELVRVKGHLSSFFDLPPEAGWLSVAFREPVTELLCWIAPRGWYYAEQRTYCELVGSYADAAFDANSPRVFPTRSEAQARQIDKLIRRPGLDLVVHHAVAASVLLPDITSLTRKAAAAQTVVDNASLACSLERFRIVNREFPAKLEMLAPGFIARLPNDLVTGKPYKYERVENGKFLLYSVGWNEKDDGGTPGTELFDGKNGDWLWEFPPE